jgi:hypothetical protein
VICSGGETVPSLKALLSSPVFAAWNFVFERTSQLAKPASDCASVLRSAPAEVQFLLPAKGIPSLVVAIGIDIKDGETNKGVLWWKLVVYCVRLELAEQFATVYFSS